MRECMICGMHRHVMRCEKVQLCTRCAEVLWEVLQPKLHPEQVQQAKTENQPQNKKCLK